jgi:hypothetical protein
MGHRVVKFKMGRGGGENRNLLRRMSQGYTPSCCRPPWLTKRACDTAQVQAAGPHSLNRKASRVAASKGLRPPSNAVIHACRVERLYW